MAIEWLKTDECLPEEDIVVMTKVEDANGCRNKQPLKRKGNLWFLPDGSMYVYYTPTHFRGGNSNYRVIAGCNCQKHIKKG